MAQNFSGPTTYITNAGLPVSGALIYTYEAGTLTPKAAYTTPDLGTPQSNPIVCDSGGHAQFVLGTGAYRIKVFLPGPGAELTQYACDNQTAPSATDTALRADLLSAASATVGAGLVGNAVFNCASRTILKAVVMAVNPSVYLTEAGRRGLFVWTAGDFSTHVAADTQEGVYVKATAVSAASGAWVRATRDDELWQTDWFGVPNASSDGTGTACQSQYSAMMATANLVSPPGVQFGSGVYAFDAKPTAATFICTVAGVESGTQPTILVKRYADTAAGLLEYTTKAPRVRNLSVQAVGSGVAAGNLALSVITSTTPIAGKPLLENFRTSMSTSNSNEILLDGSANATTDTVGLRTGNWRGLEVFGNVVMKGCHHWFGSETFIAGDLVVTGTVGVPSDDIHIKGVIGRNLDLGAGADNTGYVTRMTFHGSVQNDIKNRVNCSRVLLIADYGNTAERNWATSCRIFSVAAISDYGTNGDGVYVKFGTGDIEQWGSINTSGGSGTVTFPLAFPNTVTFKDANVSTAPASGFIELAQAHTATLSGMAIRSMSFSTAPATGLSSATVQWYAKGA